MRIGELAELAGVSTRAIRHYHRIGLLAEPRRQPNGYRSYDLRDAVLLLRIRRLIELGLSLDEVTSVLADDHGRQLRDILAELDADLAEQERRLRQRRKRIAELLARETASEFSPELTEVLGELSREYGQHLSLERERLIAQMFDAVSGDVMSSMRTVYREMFTDAEQTERMLRLSQEFEELAGRAPNDPAVADLAERAAEIGPAVRALIPKEVSDQPADESRTDLFLRVVAAGMDPAQARCFELLLEHLREDNH